MAPSVGKVLPRPAILMVGGLVAVEGVTQFLHLDLPSLLGLSAMAGGWWLLSRAQRPTSVRLAPCLEEWHNRCDALLPQFERLESASDSTRVERRRQLDHLLDRCRRQQPEVALVSSNSLTPALLPTLVEALRNPFGLSLHWAHTLPASSADWCWPEDFARCDAVIYHLKPPLRAADLRWLEALPEGQSIWLLIEANTATPAAAERLVAELRSQWPQANPDRMLFWDGTLPAVPSSVESLANWLVKDGKSQIRATELRCAQVLHGRWQADLESLRRRHWRHLQGKTQWIVAAGVAVAPLPSMDLIVLAVANGLMLQEMARLWNCAWTVEQLRTAALELAKASLAMGVVEWSGQALAGAMKFHGATWLIGSALQAISAAYLTRVVSHAMADMLALSAGVSAPDLEAIKRQAPLLVARAAEAERLNWAAFLSQARQWLQQGGAAAAPLAT